MSNAPDVGDIRKWRKSSRSYGSGNCVEVSVPDGQRVCVRDGKNPQGAVLQFTTAEWNAFKARIRKS
ncbi:MAG TPA: DUF397 domain-containing protein [Trebonia sp.]|nr:DUF397 domain-containing protein [Trebonia sp.]